MTIQKTVLTFFCDDTNPYVAPPEAFKIFLDFVAAEGIAGESSVILGYQWTDQGLLSYPSTKVQSDYNEQIRRAYDCGLDTHFELMTHDGLFDFIQNRMPDGVIHEGLWLFEPGVTVQEYDTYFSHILTEGERIGLRYTGITWPGCGCDVCTRRYAELKAAGITEPNPQVWQALLNLAKRGKFRGNTVPCFFGDDLDKAKAHLKAQDGRFGIYDLQPNMTDRFGIWLNSVDYVNADYYISEDGQSGRIIDLIKRGEPYCLFYAHWQGLNPVNGVGWGAFKLVISRVQRHLQDQVEWMRPSDYTNRLIVEAAK